MGHPISNTMDYKNLIDQIIQSGQYNKYSYAIIIMCRLSHFEMVKKEKNS
jgi:hypothetical protein